MKNLFKTIATAAILLAPFTSHAQGDYKLETRGKVDVTWRLVSDFQPVGASCWGWTYHIFISNANGYPITLKNNEAYQDKGDYSSCWQGGSVPLGGEVIPAGKWREFTFRVSSAANGGTPGKPGLRYGISWDDKNAPAGRY